MPAGWAAAVGAAGAVGGALISADATSKASDKASEGAERSAARIEEAAATARGDVFDFFPSAQKDLLSGAGAAGGLISSGVGEQQRLLSAGNVGAQQTLGAGFTQQQNALLGLPVNQQAFAPREIELSPALQNPLAQNIQQDPAAQQTLKAQQVQRWMDSTPQQKADLLALSPQQLAGLQRRAEQNFQPQNLFSDVGQVKQEADKKVIGGLQTNRDVISAISRGDIEVTGVDLSFFDALAADNPGWDNQGTLLEAMKVSPQALERSFEGSGLSIENQQKWKTLVRELQRISGGIVS